MRICTNHVQFAVVGRLNTSMLVVLCGTSTVGVGWQVLRPELSDMWKRMACYRMSLEQRVLHCVRLVGEYLQQVVLSDMHVLPLLVNLIGLGHVLIEDLKS